ncbi:MAG: dockerin type I domain-containing protein [Phycisphaerales bacterium]
MQHRSKGLTHTQKCAAAFVGALAVASGVGAQITSDWSVVEPPHAFSYAELPPSYLESGRIAQWNLAQEFDRGTLNPAGVWTIGFSLNRFGAFSISPNWGITLPTTFGWFNATNGTFPTAAQPLTATSYPTLGTGVSLPAGAVGLLPDSLGKFAAVRWTAPEQGQYAIDAQFTGRSTLEVGVSDIMVLRNGMQLFYSQVRDPRQIVLMRTTFDLVAGETLEFRVGKGTDTNQNDLKQLDVVIQRLPRLCPGDINGDGTVNTNDLTQLIGEFGNTVIPSEGGDLNGDGIIDLNDLTLLLGNLGCLV